MIDMPESSYCATCGYCLAGLEEPRCPECGRAFDPLNPATFSDSARLPPRWPWVLAWIAIAYPVLPLCAFAATYVVAWLSLGHTPRPNLDDPKSINVMVSILHGLVVVLLSFTVAAMVLSLIATVCVSCTTRFPDRLRRTLQCFAISFIVWNLWGLVGPRILLVIFCWFGD